MINNQNNNNMKKHYETPLLETIELSTEGGILENSIFVTMALLEETTGPDTRDMEIVNQDW